MGESHISKLRLEARGRANPRVVVQCSSGSVLPSSLTNTPKNFHEGDSSGDIAPLPCEPGEPRVFKSGSAAAAARVKSAGPVRSRRIEGRKEGKKTRVLSGLLSRQVVLVLVVPTLVSAFSERGQRTGEASNNKTLDQGPTRFERRSRRDRTTRFAAEDTSSSSSFHQCRRLSWPTRDIAEKRPRSETSIDLE